MAIGAGSLLGSQYWLGMAEHRGSNGNLLSQLIRVWSATACVQPGEGAWEMSAPMVICKLPQGGGRMHKIRWWGWCRRGGKLLASYCEVFLLSRCYLCTVHHLPSFLSY